MSLLGQSDHITTNPDNRFILFGGDSVDVLDKRAGNIKEGTVDFIFTDPTPANNITDTIKLCKIFDKCKRVLKSTGSIVVVMADFHDEKGSLELVPFTFAKRMKENHGWTVRNDIIWHRLEAAVRAYPIQEDHNRFLRDHDFIFWFTQGRFGYYFDKEMEKQPLRSVFSMSTVPVKPGEFRTPFPVQLIREIIHILCPPGGLVMDPFCGPGSTGIAALELGRRFIGIEKKEHLIPKIGKNLKAVIHGLAQEE